MSDIVERLRKQAMCVYLATEKGPADDLADGLNKAADEIERLQRENKKLLAQLGYLQASSGGVR